MHTTPAWPLTLYYDGDCPLCAREIRLLRRRADPQRLQLVDISADDFDATALGFRHRQLQGRLHARFADGHWVSGVEATYWSWLAAGLGIARLLQWPWLRRLLEPGYRLFCLLRPHLEWLPHPDGARRCKDQHCDLPGRRR